MIKRNQTRSLAEDIAELIQRRKHVSMVEIMKLAGDEGKGDISLALDYNIVLWGAVSSALADAMDELRQKKLVHPHNVHHLVYLIDGAIMELPIATQPPTTKNGYKEPHWFPIVFQPGTRCPDDPECPWYEEIG